MRELPKDNLKDYLTSYSDEEIEKIRENKIQLVTVREKETEKRELSIFDLLQIIVLGVILVLCFIYLFKDYFQIPLNIN